MWKLKYIIHNHTVLPQVATKFTHFRQNIFNNMPLYQIPCLMLTFDYYCDYVIQKENVVQLDYSLDKSLE